MCGSSISQHKILGKRLNRSQGRSTKSKTGITTTIVKCNDCGLIYSNPKPIPFSIQDHYGIPPESYWTQDYLKVNDSHFLEDIQNFKKLLNFKGEEKVLDIGAGIGQSMIALSKAGFDTYGIEPSESFYKRAIEKMNIDSSRLKLASIENIDYPENYFDLIMFSAVLEHVYDPSESIQKAMKWLKPNGIIWIEVPSSNWLISKIINTYYRLRGSDYVCNLSPMHSPFHLHEFGLKSFKKHGGMHNYEIAMFKYYVCETYLPKSFNYVLKRYMKWTNTGMQLSVWLRKK